jgi:hypothetical protein
MSRSETSGQEDPSIRKWRFEQAAPGGPTGLRVLMAGSSIGPTGGSLSRPPSSDFRALTNSWAVGIEPPASNPAPYAVNRLEPDWRGPDESGLEGAGKPGNLPDRSVPMTGSPFPLP